MLQRKHNLPQTITLSCLLCGRDTSWSLHWLANIDETPTCSGCGNDVDPRIERDLRNIANAVLSLQAFLPENQPFIRPRREKSWNVKLDVPLP